MNIIAAAGGRITVAAILLVAVTVSADEGFVSMFDGKSLTGWVVSPVQRVSGMDCSEWTHHWRWRQGPQLSGL